MLLPAQIQTALRSLIAVIGMFVPSTRKLPLSQIRGDGNYMPLS